MSSSLTKTKFKHKPDCKLATEKEPAVPDGGYDKEIKTIIPTTKNAIVTSDTGLEIGLIKSQKDDRGKFYFVFQCPHCGDTMFLYRKEVECGKIRHGTILTKNRQLHFNISDKKCAQLLRDKLVAGCTKPFRVVIARPELSSSSSKSDDDDDEWLQVSTVLKS